MVHEFAFPFKFSTPATFDFIFLLLLRHDQRSIASNKTNVMLHPSFLLSFLFMNLIFLSDYIRYIKLWFSVSEIKSYCGETAPAFQKCLRDGKNYSVFNLFLFFRLHRTASNLGVRRSISTIPIFLFLMKWIVVV